MQVKYLLYVISMIIFKEMNKKIFYRNNSNKATQLLRGNRSSKLSMDDLTPLASRMPSEVKKRNSNDNHEYSKFERSSFKKGRMNATVSAGSSLLNSMLMTKSSSPVKFSVRNSQLNQNKLRAYKFYYQIGFGGFGRVWKVCNKESMQDLAMKEISKRKVIQKNNIDSVLNERKILSHLSHSFLINMKCAFQDAHNLYLVMDYLRGGDLRYHICYKAGFSEKEVRFITANILIGLEYIHLNRIIHKDLKPENLVFEESGYIRITDFGIARNEGNDPSVNSRNQSSGTPVYMAPEILFKKDYSYQSDFYALGVIIYQLVMGRRPYEGKNRAELREEILKRDIKLEPQDLPLGYSPYMCDLINRLLRKNPSQRLGNSGIKEIKQHRYLADIKWRRLERKEVKPPYVPSVICEMREYLDEIALFNQMNEQNQENIMAIEKELNDKFIDYDYDRSPKHPKMKPHLKKGKRFSQKKII